MRNERNDRAARALSQAPIRRTCQATLAVVATPLFAVALLAAFVVTCELAARTEFARSHLLEPGVGSPSPILEQQLTRLNALVETEGGVDCIFFGDSLALNGFDPDAFGAEYHERTGNRIRCFNFAVMGLTATGAAAVGRILLEDYHPWLLFYGLSVRDFSPSAQGPALEDIPWVKYRWGIFSVDGWLTEKSYAYRYYLAYRRWSDPEARRIASFLPRLSSTGFWDRGAAVSDYAIQLAAAKDLLAPILKQGVSDHHLSGLEKLLQLRERGLRIVVLEMPVHTSVVRWFEEEPAVYQIPMARIRNQVQRCGAPFWETQSQRLVPEDGWGDVWHTNGRGARVFSRWLGARVAGAVETGELAPPGGQPRL